MFLADLHIHSTFSDGRLTIPEIVDLYGQRGYGAIAITDHLCETDTLWGKVAQHLRLSLTPATFPIYQAIIQSEAARAWTRYRMIVIPGYEITQNPFLSQDASHVLALGVTDYISADGAIEPILQAIRAKDGITIAAHPRPTPDLSKQTLYLWTHRDRLNGALDAWETANGKTFFDEVEASGLPVLACSDFHKLSDLSSWKTAFDCKRNPKALLAAIRAQDLAVQYVEETLDDLDSATVLDPFGRRLIAVPVGNRTLARAF